MKKGNQYQRGNVFRGPQRGRVLLRIRHLLSLNEPEIHRIFALYLSEVKDRFPFLGRETSVVPQLQTSWSRRKSGRYARVTRLNNTPDPEGSCMVRERSDKKNPRFGNLAVASAIEAYVKPSFSSPRKAEPKHVGGVLATPEWTVSVSLRSRLPTSQYFQYCVGRELTIRRDS